MVSPPFIVRSSRRYWEITSAARDSFTGMPLVIFQVSGLWQ
jgi:hypothetical protein